MKLIINFYQELDAFNRILFWGVIIVILLLLIFAFILINKNRKLKAIITKRGININDFDMEDDDSLAIKRTRHEEDEEIHVHKIYDTEQKTISRKMPEVPVKQPQVEIVEEPDIPILNKPKEEAPVVTKQEVIIPRESTEKFVAEEHVMDYNNPVKKSAVVTDMPNREPANEVPPSPPRTPYQQNLLRSVPTNQTTSPVGIIKKNDEAKEEMNKAVELYQNLSDSRFNNPNKQPSNYQEALKRELDKQAVISQNDRPKGNYLKELQQKLNNDDDIKRTDYEIEQEENAIISFKELMEKKDNLKMVDEEDAVISIEELVAREKEKLYNITTEEENEEFMNELKKFRNDL